ncbi:hypothetical protein [Novipirellula sp.]|uniref:hypothetical protein n=1 Tax=Novipirellula sp. TaxID=2795430 RepID=UPI003566F2DF
MRCSHIERRGCVRSRLVTAFSVALRTSARVLTALSLGFPSHWRAEVSALCAKWTVQVYVTGPRRPLPAADPPEGEGEIDDAGTPLRCVPPFD